MFAVQVSAQDTVVVQAFQEIVVQVTVAGQADVVLLVATTVGLFHQPQSQLPQPRQPQLLVRH
jgi:hypothetical protein